MAALWLALLSACSGGGGGSSTSSPRAGPIITQQPQSLIVDEGQPASFTGVASGVDVSYQWYRNGAILSGAHAPTYSIPSATLGDSGEYMLVASNSADAVSSDTAVLQVNPVGMPAIVVQPESETVFIASPATFSVGAMGQDLTYQWYRDGAPIAGETQSSYSIALTLPESAGSYHVIVSNPVASVSSVDATLTVTSPVAPVVADQPQSRSVRVGSPVVLSVSASGLLLQYQWYKDGILIGGARSPSYAIASATTADSGRYFVIVSNLGGSATSDQATVTVTTGVVVGNGAAAGALAPGDTVHVFANPAAAGSIFDHWEGDASILANPLRTHTTFTLGANSVSLAAVFRTVPQWTETRDRIDGLDFWYYVPPAPAGIIYLWHGTGGSGPQWFFQTAYLEFVRAAVARGYGVAALTASSSELGWTMQPIALDNPDLANAVAANDRLESLGLIRADTPRYSLGMSSGGRFSVRFCAVLGCAAQATVCAQADPEALMMSTSVPTRFNMAFNDTAPNISNSDARRYSASMLARGVASAFELQAPSPLAPVRFSSLTGATPDDALAIYSALAGGGIIDERGFLLADPATDPSGWKSVIPAPHSLIPLRMFEIGQVLAIAYAEHEFYSEHTPETLAFFDAHR